MTASERFEFEISDEIRRHALSFPEATEGSSCVNRAFKTAGKNFAFLGEAFVGTDEAECRLRLKLGPSIDDAATRDDPRVEIGSGGWTMVRFAPDDAPPQPQIQAWIEESFRLLAPRKVVAAYDET